MRHPLPKAVILLGWASLISDIASESVYPVLPLFLTTTLGASVIFVGLLEGCVEALSSILKLAAGYLSDRLERREPFVLGGYIISNLLRPFIGFAASPIQVLAVRVGDRIGKGIRTSPRDAWLASHSTPESRGRIFGFHRGMDNAGATLAPLLTAAFLFFYPGDYRTLFLLSLIPGLIALIFVWKAIQVQSGKNLSGPKSPPIRISEIRSLPREFKIYLGVLFLFTLSLSTDAFIILKLHELGVTAFWVTILWALHNGIRMFSSFWGGRFSDRIGHRKAIRLGWTFYALVYFLLGLVHTPWFAIPLIMTYGIYYGLTETAEKALVVEMVEKRFHGTALGLYQFVLGIGAIPAGLIFGGLWKFFGSSTAFLFSSMISILAILLLSSLVSKDTYESR